jgi:hypothetical protein
MNVIGGTEQADFHALLFLSKGESSFILYRNILSQHIGVSTF